MARQTLSSFTLGMCKKNTFFFIVLVAEKKHKVEVFYEEGKKIAIWAHSFVLKKTRFLSKQKGLKSLNFSFF